MCKLSTCQSKYVFQCYNEALTHFMENLQAARLMLELMLIFYEHKCHKYSVQGTKITTDERSVGVVSGEDGTPRWLGDAT